MAKNVTRNVTPQEKALARLRMGQPVGLVTSAVGLTVAEVQTIADAMPKPTWYAQLDAAGLPQYEKLHLQKSALMAADCGCELTIKPVAPVDQMQTLAEIEAHQRELVEKAVANAGGPVTNLPPGTGKAKLADQIAGRAIRPAADAMPWEEPTEEPVPWEHGFTVQHEDGHTEYIPLATAEANQTEELPWD
jgi:hypothetical protein